MSLGSSSNPSIALLKKRSDSDKLFFFDMITIYVIMPSYCSIEEAFDNLPDWIERDPEPCNYGSQDVNTYVDRASGIPSNLMTDDQSQYLLYKQLQNKFSMIGPPPSQTQPQVQTPQQVVEPFVSSITSMFAANDVDRLIIILLAGIILLSIIDYGLTPRAMM